jgi:hypothetical protein
MGLIVRRCTRASGTPVSSQVKKATGKETVAFARFLPFSEQTDRKRVECAQQCAQTVCPKRRAMPTIQSPLVIAFTVRGVEKGVVFAASPIRVFV